MIRHLSCPRDWKSRSADPLSCSSWKNFNESFPVGPSSSIACVKIQQSHSWMMRTLASLCFIGAYSPATVFLSVDSQVIALVWSDGEVLTPPRVSAPSRLHYNKLLNKSSSLSVLPAKRSICAFVCPSKGPTFDADSDEFLRQARLGVSSCQGMSVMGNAYPASGDRKRYSSSSAAHGDSTWDQETDSNRVLAEENVRLRALVVQLSNLVLRNVVDQHNTPSMQPIRRRLPD
jgi:hypothetical protein